MKVDSCCIERYLGSDLKTYDPYDLWKTRLGLQLKKLYYWKGKITIPIVGPFYLLDAYAPRLIRLFIKPQEYPIVRAFAVLSALNYFEITSEKKYLELARESVEWLIANQSPGYSGACWGLNMPWMTKTGYSPPSTPFVTVTPYCVEALLKFSDLTNNEKSHDVALTALEFLENDLFKLVDDPHKLAVSYGPAQESRIVINGNSYAMMLYALFASRFFERQEVLTEKANRLYNFIKSHQNPDGSWFYYADNEKGNFIDCFHSCYVLKNTIKYSNLTGIDVSDVINNGIEYLLVNFIDGKCHLVRRFSVSANPSLVKFDLYDQAELLNVLLMTGRLEAAEKLFNAINKYFYIPSKKTFGHYIDVLGILHKMIYLRWAVMPMIYVQSEFYKTIGRKEP